MNAAVTQAETQALRAAFDGLTVTEFDRDGFPMPSEKGFDVFKIKPELIDLYVECEIDRFADGDGEPVEVNVCGLWTGAGWLPGYDLDQGSLRYWAGMVLEQVQISDERAAEDQAVAGWEDRL